MRKIRRIDLRLADIADFVIVRLDMTIFACGSFEEIFLANRQKKPVLIWCPQGKPEAADWLFGTLPHEHFFGSLEDLKDYVENVDHGKVGDLGRWTFFDPEQLYPSYVWDRLKEDAEG